MTPDDLKARTKKFAVDVIRFAKAIPKDHITMKLPRSWQIQRHPLRRTIVPCAGRNPERTS
jgi:hypothetical protein